MTGSKMNIYEKLNKARVAFHSEKLQKTGHNKFAGYKYFELGDFVPTAIRIFNDVGICQFVTFTNETATMTIVSVDDQSQIQFTSPMGSANLKGCHEVQNIGAVETYQRRYLWTTALEIVEHDALDAQTGNSEPEQGSITEAQVAKLKALLDKTPLTEQKICKAYNVETLEALPVANYKGAEKRLTELAKAA